LVILKFRILKGAKKPDNIKEGNWMNKKKELLKIRKSLRLLNNRIIVLSREVLSMNNTMRQLPSAEPQDLAEEEPGKE
jgi:hypothetical protein